VKQVVRVLSCLYYKQVVDVTDTTLTLQDLFVKFAWVMYQVTKVCREVESFQSNCAFGRQWPKHKKLNNSPNLVKFECIGSQCIMIQKGQLQVYSSPSNTYNSAARELRVYHL
jgi:hypothetical protein